MISGFRLGPYLAHSGASPDGAWWVGPNLGTWGSKQGQLHVRQALKPPRCVALALRQGVNKVIPCVQLPSFYMGINKPLSSSENDLPKDVGLGSDAAGPGLGLAVLPTE